MPHEGITLFRHGVGVLTWAEARRWTPSSSRSGRAGYCHRLSPSGSALRCWGREAAPPVFAFASSSPPARLACEEPEIARPEGKKKGEAPSRYQKPEQRASLWLQEQVPGVWLARFPHTPGLAEPRSGIFSCTGTLLRASTLVMVLTSFLCSLPW